MPQATRKPRSIQEAKRALASVRGRGLITAISFARDIRALIRDFLSSFAASRGYGLLLDQLRQPLSILGEHLRMTSMASWITGFDWAFKQVPQWVGDKIFPPILPGPKRPSDQAGSTPPRIWFPRIFDDEPKLRFLNIEAAADRLLARKIMTRDQFDAADAAARKDAFTFTADVEQDVIGRVRDTLAEDIQDGTSLTGFTNKLNARLDTSMISDARLETIYRWQTQKAFSDGDDTLMQNPIVSAVFPYRAYVAIHDGRVRHTHLECETHGLDGTNVYRADDPFWETHRPPWDYNCRCMSYPMTLDKAAAAGVSEAKEWMRTGRPPVDPEHRGPLRDEITPVRLSVDGPKEGDQRKNPRSGSPEVLRGGRWHTIQPIQEVRSEPRTPEPIVWRNSPQPEEFV